MNTDHVRFFISAIDEGSYAAAADKHYMSPEGISKAVRSLEKTTNATLVLRRNGRIEPTEDGRLLYAAGKEIIASIDNLKNDMDRSGD